MKKANKFLVLLAIVALMGSVASVNAQPKDIPDILGEYVGELTVSNDMFGSETFSDVTMELNELAPDYSLKVAKIEIVGIELPEYEMKVGITQDANGYKLTQKEALKFTIEELETPLGTMYDVPVEITLTNGNVKDNVLTLVIKVVATIDLMGFPMPVTIDVNFEGVSLIPACDPITNPKAAIENCKTATITWDAVEGAMGYEISRDGILLDSPTAPTFTETAEFENGKTYTWMIKTVCDADESSVEVPVSATAECSCDPVTGAKAEIENCETAIITWNPVDGAIGYTISRNGIALVVTTPSYTETAEFENDKTYTWTIKTLCGNGEAEAIEVEATADCEVYSISELTNTVSVHPNPTNGQLTIDNGGLRVESVEIFNVLGKCVATIETRNYPPLAGAGGGPKSETIINISDLPTGIYFLRIQTENGMVTKRVVKN